MLRPGDGGRKGGRKGDFGIFHRSFSPLRVRAAPPPPAFFHFRGFSGYVTSHLFQFYSRGRSQAEVIVEVPTARAVGPSSLFLHILIDLDLAGNLISTTSSLASIQSMPILPSAGMIDSSLPVS